MERNEVIENAARVIEKGLQRLAEIENSVVKGPVTMDRNEAIARIKAALKARTKTRFSVTGGKGTAWGWIEIKSIPSRTGEFGYMSEADQKELSELLGKKVHHQGESIPASSDYRQEYVDRAEGKVPTVYGEQYWD